MTRQQIILEMETGLMDGIYFDYDQSALEGIRGAWDENRPSFTHLICDIKNNENKHYSIRGRELNKAC